MVKFTVAKRSVIKHSSKGHLDLIRFHGNSACFCRLQSLFVAVFRKIFKDRSISMNVYGNENTFTIYERRTENVCCFRSVGISNEKKMWSYNLAIMFSFFMFACVFQFLIIFLSICLIFFLQFVGFLFVFVCFCFVFICLFLFFVLFWGFCFCLFVHFLLSCKHHVVVVKPTFLLHAFIPFILIREIGTCPWVVLCKFDLNGKEYACLSSYPLKPIPLFERVLIYSASVKSLCLLENQRLPEDII